MRLGADHVRVRVPATSANLGPGFDAFGLALDLVDELEVHALGSPGVRVEVSGEGAGQVPDDEQHLVISSLRAALDHVGAPQTGLHLVCHNRIPHGRGLGSSAAAVVAGIVAARGLIAEPEALSDDVVIDLAGSIEGHPDNAAPAVLGGATLAWKGDSGFRAIGLAVDPSVVPIAIVPPTHLSTKAARGVLPASIPHADGAFQAGRAALLVEALGRRPELLLTATEDRLHQEYRRSVMRDSLALVDTLRSRGVPAVVSGAGPTVLVLARSAGVGTDADDAIAAAFGGAMGGWQVLRLAVDRSGATVELGSPSSR
ncbi:homoserine kinase [Cellulomonas sp. URHD0024]|uniref:homoserine kinase n=1 Tax=Cellulomonas sp. URHD0024 TaxID=1302620 RepID=UPI00041CD4C7|nr:homoserine kinase [Cellulomonas sp. URHD0024]